MNLNRIKQQLLRLKPEYFDYKLNNRINLKNIQKNFINFYNEDTIQPYIPAIAGGPWILTTEDKLIYDAGGYGMLGLGHNPYDVLNKLSKPQVMANIMTPNYSQLEFSNLLLNEIGDHNKIIALNSGSEANTLAMRIANIHNKSNSVLVSMKGSFHGRTENPSKVSESCQNSYIKYLNEYNNKYNYNNKKIYFIDYNNLNNLEETFNIIKKNNEFPEITLFEPVQGEGNPGNSITPSFYNKLRKLTKEMGGLLLADSIQAGIRCTGELSITRYPGFENIDPPDFETFSKALNAGQFPLSILAVNKNIKNRYKTGLYGNTMTGNPRGLDIASVVLKNITPQLKINIINSGKLLLEYFKNLEQTYPFINNITGTGLLLAIHLDKSIPVLEIEKNLRLRGLNVIHGGENALRFTPWFKINKEEIEYICSILEDEFDTLL
tara:strand:+ start:43 stop:1350 length:1308 start_codon:yes stop_codon:yes gene_type:complete